MNFDKDLVAGKLRRWDRYLNRYHLPAWEEIPDIGLYMEQVVTLLRGYLDYLPPELKEEEAVTAAPFCPKRIKKNRSSPPAPSITMCAHAPCPAPSKSAITDCTWPTSL